MRPGFSLANVQMRPSQWLAILLWLCLLAGCGTSEQPANPAPEARRVGHQIMQFGESRDDPYAWMSDQGYKQELLELIAAENRYADYYFEQSSQLQARLMAEFEQSAAQPLAVDTRPGLSSPTSNSPSADNSSPAISSPAGNTSPAISSPAGNSPSAGNSSPANNSSIPSPNPTYWRETRPGFRYPFFMRSIPAEQAGEAGKQPGSQLMLDVNQLAEGYDYFALGHFDLDVNSGQLLLTQDTSGDQRYELLIQTQPGSKPFKPRHARQPDSSNPFKPDLAHQPEGSNPQTARLAHQSDSGKPFKFSHARQPGNSPPDLASLARRAYWDPADNQAFYYLSITQPDHQRRFLYRHQLQTGVSELLHEEIDPSFQLRLFRTESLVYLVSERQQENRLWLIAGRSLHRIEGTGPPSLTRISKQGDQLYLLSNKQHPGFAMYRTAILPLGQQAWQKLYAPKDAKAQIEDFELLNQHLAVLERSRMNYQIQLLARDGSLLTTIKHQPEDVISLLPSSDNLEYEVSSLARPTQRCRATPASLARDAKKADDKVMQANGHHQHAGLLKEPLIKFNIRCIARRIQEKAETYQAEGRGLSEDARLLGVEAGLDQGFLKPDQVQRLWFSSADGTQVPITLVYATQSLSGSLFSPDLSQRPLLITAYGAYGMNVNIEHDPYQRPLLDRGLILASIHVRGGGELGLGWHLAATGTDKQLALADLLAGIRFLADAGYGDPARRVARGTSAGGTLIAAAMLHDPNLFKAVVLVRPFVDLLNSLGDDSAPLAVPDRLEWGDPGTRAGFLGLRQLSPYENVRQLDYPPLFIRAALHDTRVRVQGPLKWLARLRHHQEGRAQQFLQVSMTSGHAGPSDVDERRLALAREYAFIIRSLP